ncbi:unnamed protein product [Nezara viridula]|uniref:Aminopeptidase n=1 Tax=Nezara viridula TaxID=85310 RepID=A0A9P0MPH8_NEZVI|nr:unnamed protein product [Nezara viridula]
MSVLLRKPVCVLVRLPRYRYSVRLVSRIRVSSTQSLRSTNGSCWASLNKLPLYNRNLSAFINKQLPYIPGANCYSNIAAIMGKTEIGQLPEKKPFERLPKNVKPLHYDLQLKPNLETFVFEGKVGIKLQVNEPTSKIILNALELEIKSCFLLLENGTELKPKVDLSIETETATLTFDQAIPAGIAHLTIEFKGELNDKMKGFYRSNHSNLEGQKCYCAVTQFEATDARRCFPCWDEPAIKSVFEVTLIAPKGNVALSNMPVVSESEDGDCKVVKFAPTPIMSTYLVAVVVGDFAYVEDTSSDGILVRVYTPPAVKDQGLFALHVATKVLPYYKEYFQVAYPLPKMDLVAIGDFSAGAMENWGLVTYRQSALLVDSENTSASRKQWVAVVVGHELAHQWFGNLVTMEWWTHLWLNEGYATFVENLCVAHLFPEYDIWTQFVSDIYTRALELDCLKSSHPIEIPVGHPSEVDEIFDDISYSKGASVIRMLHRYLGDSDFRKGMNTYLTRHQYSNTFTEDLWAALEEASKKPVKDVMSTWTKQTGFPVIRVTESKQIGDVRELTLAQERFCADADTAGDSSLWMVPLTFSTKSKPNDIVHSCVLETRNGKVQVPAAPDDWVKINPGTVGVYRTQYAQYLLDQFIPAIQDKSLPPLDRLGIVDDLFALVQAGHCNTVQVLKVISAMKDEDNYTVWFSIGNCLSKLRVLISNTDFMDSFKKFGRDLFKPVSHRVGWDPRPDESHLDKLLRSLVLAKLGSYDDAETIEEAKRRFADHVSKKSIIPADLRASVYRAVLSVGDESTYDTMIKMYKEETLQEEKERISRSLGAFKDTKILSKVLDFAMSDEVRPQDKVFVIISVALDKGGRELAWEFLKQNWTDLHSRYEGGFLMARLVKNTVENFSTFEKADEIESFFASRDTSCLDRSISQAVESVRLNAAWLTRDRDSIRQFLENHK